MGQEQVLSSSYYRQCKPVVRKQSRLACTTSHLGHAGSAGATAAEKRYLGRPIPAVEFHTGSLPKAMPLMSHRYSGEGSNPFTANNPWGYAGVGGALDVCCARPTRSFGGTYPPLLSSRVRHPLLLPLQPVPTGVGARYIQPMSSSSRGCRRAPARRRKKVADRPAPIAQQQIQNARALEVGVEAVSPALRIGGDAEAGDTASEDGVGGIAGGEQSNDQGIIVVQRGCGEGCGDGSSWEDVYEKWRSWLKKWAVKGVECVGDVVETTVVCCVRGLRIAETTMLPFFWLISPHRCSPFVWT